MARNQGPFIPDDESTPVSRPDEERGNGAPFRRGNRRASTDVDEPDVDRFAALGEEEEDGQQFRRAPRRVPVRRAVTKKTAQRLKIILLILIAAGVVASVCLYLYSYGKHSWRFRVESGDDIQITGNQHVSRAQIMRVMGGDIGRNVFFIPLDERKQKLEEIPWVESATVMRFLPNHLRIDIRERVPVAFVQNGGHAELIDASGVFMEMPKNSSAADWEFPVITGMSDNEPLSTRAPRMKKYQKLIAELDSSGAKYSRDLDEVDVSDPDDVKISVRVNNHPISLDLGTENFLENYTVFKAHVEEWLQQYQNLKSVDLRYPGQVILNPEGGASQTAAVSAKDPPPGAAKKIRRKR